MSRPAETIPIALERCSCAEEKSSGDAVRRATRDPDLANVKGTLDTAGVSGRVAMVKAKTSPRGSVVPAFTTKDAAAAEFDAAGAELEKSRWTVPGEPRPCKRSLWHLAGVEARAFGGRQANAIFWGVPFKAAMLLSLIAYERREHPSGQALCLLGVKPGRVAGGAAVLALVVCVAGVLWPPLGVIVGAAIVLALLPSVVGAARSLRGTLRLRRLTPPGPHIYVHSVASTIPGAGAELVAALAEEADQQGWSLLLDASNERLARYYEQFGFLPQGTPVEMPNGGRHVRMWRQPVPRQEGRRGPQ